MGDTTGTPKLNAALAKAQASMEAAEKGALNPAFKDASQPNKAKGTSYADLADIVAATRPHLTANGLAVCQEPMEAMEGWVKLRTVLLHESGEERASVLSLPCVGKTPQNYGAALTYARRYGYSAMVGAVAEDDDGNAASGKDVPTVRREKHAPKAAAGVPPMPHAGNSREDYTQAVANWADDVTREVDAIRAASQAATAPAQVDALRPRYNALRQVMDAPGWTALGEELKAQKAALAVKGAA